jgi:hypothetical protein
MMVRPSSRATNGSHDPWRTSVHARDSQNHDSEIVMIAETFFSKNLCTDGQSAEIITAVSLHRVFTRVPDAPVVGDVPYKLTEGIVNVAATRFHFRCPELIPVPVGAKYFRSLIGELNSDSKRRRAVRREINVVELNLKV